MKIRVQRKKYIKRDITRRCGNQPATKMYYENTKHRILQNNCLLINYNVVIPRSIVFGNTFMTHIKKPTQFGTIPTLRLEAMRGLSHRILQLNCLFNNYNVVIPRSILFNSISMLKTNTLVQFEPIPCLHSEVTRNISKLAFHNLFIII